ncbi:MAG: rhodanese-like domain-containing protein [Actinomycetota bacterium]
MNKWVKRGSIILACAVLAIAIASAAIASTGAIKIIVSGQELNLRVAPSLQSGTVSAPVRAITEAFGAEVAWDGDKRAVIITAPGNRFLGGLNGPKLIESTKTPSIHDNFVTATQLRDILDDDKDGDLCDYRSGHNGGDSIANDPLVIDVRQKADYDKGHIPGAIWIASAQDMAKTESITALRAALASHLAKGGKNVIVIYCYTAHTAGLAAGVLGANGFNVKNLRYGYNISWEGSMQADTPIKGPRENSAGQIVPY